MPFNQTAFDYHWAYQKIRRRLHLAQQPDRIRDWQQAREACDWIARHRPDAFEKALRSVVDRSLSDPLTKPFVQRFEDAQLW